MDRAYSVLTVKTVQDDQRIILGTATSPVPDRLGDIVEPLGVQFKNPLSLLWHHRSDSPVGTVIFNKPTKDGITFEARIAKISEPGPLKDRVDTAWGEVKAGLIRGVSIGFRSLEAARMGDGGVRFVKSECLELSLVAVPANADATITMIKSLDAAQRAASGHTLQRVAHTPGVSGKPVSLKAPEEGKAMKTLAEQITALEAKRAANVARQQAVMQKSIDDGRSTDTAEQEDFDTADQEIDAIDKDLGRLRKLEKTMALTAKAVPVTEIKSEAGGSAVRGGSSIVVKTPPKEEPGINFTRLVKIKTAARLDGESRLVTAQRMYGPDSEVVGIITKANEVVAGTTISGNWAADLVSAEGAAAAAFLEYLRPATILGKFGTNGIPSLTKLDFYHPYVIETGAGAAYWTGEGKPKPVVAFDYDRSTMTPLKCANICVLTEENIRYSSPNSDMLVRNALVKAIAQELDLAFITPANSGTANVKPASVTNGASSIVSTGDDADAIRVDVRALFQKFINANNAPSEGVWVMSATNALSLSMLVNPLGQPEFNGISMSGGTFQGLPVIVSQHISNVVAIINASQIFLGDEGGIAVDMSREAWIEMRSTGLGMDATTGAATVGSVSMFQTNSVALRAEVIKNWKRARTSAVAYLTSADWGGAVPTA